MTFKYAKQPLINISHAEKWKDKDSSTQAYIGHISESVLHPQVRPQPGPTAPQIPKML